VLTGTMAEPPPAKRAKINDATMYPSRSSSDSSTLMDENIDRNNEGLLSPSMQSNFDTSHFINSDLPNYDLPLYYDGLASADPSGPRVASRILMRKDAESEPLHPATLASGWTNRKLSVNLFIESSFQIPGLERQCHLQFESDFTITKAGDIRRQLAIYLETDDFNIQLEFQSTMSKVDTTILNRTLGTCQRPYGLWNDTHFDDRTAIGKILSEAQSSTPGRQQPDQAGAEAEYSWFRVSRVESISLNMFDGNFTCTITPDQMATVRSIRELTATLRSTVPGAVRLQIYDREMQDDDFPLQAEGLTPGSRIFCLLELVECAVCGDDETPYAEFEDPITIGCLHKRQTCSACLRRWIATKLDNGQWNAIGCPGDDCKEVLQYIDVRRLASEEHFERYENLATRAALGSMPDFHWCMAPGCESGQIHEDGDDDMFQCNACNTKSCVKCNRKWHENETCEQFLARMGSVSLKDLLRFKISENRYAYNCIFADQRSRSGIRKDG
jgi:hypothetical protein